MGGAIWGFPDGRGGGIGDDGRIGRSKLREAKVNRFSQIKVFLDAAVNGEQIGRHGPFWRGMSRNEFIALPVFGLPILIVGDGAGSNLIRALRGQGLPRMPAGFPNMPNDRIAFIESWIDDGCPSELSANVGVDSAAGGGMDPDLHNHYWRQFDNWAMRRDDPLSASVGRSFELAARWSEFVGGTITDAEFTEAVRRPDTRAAIELLAGRQMQSVESHYENPVQMKSLLESYALFGRGVDNGGLPPDNLRPGDRPHQMNGRQMWFNWCAMVDATQRLDPPLQPDFWAGHGRAILLGLLNDGVIRERFPVDGFSKTDANVSEAMQDHVESLTPDALYAELRARFAVSGLRLPF